MALAQSYFAGMSNPFAGVLDSYDKGLQTYNMERELYNQDQANQRNQQALQALQTLDHTDPVALQKYNLLYGDLPVAKNAQTAFSQLQAKEQQNMLGELSKNISLFRNGGGATVVQNARDKANLYAQSGNKAKAMEYNQFADLAEKNPNAAYSSLMMGYAAATNDKVGGNLKNVVEAISPQGKIVNGGDAQYNVKTDNLTGDSTATKIINNGTSPDKVLDNQTQLVTTGMNNTSAENVANTQANSAANVANISGQWGVRKEDVAGQYGLKREQLNQQGQNQRTQAQLQLDAQKLEHQKQQDDIKNHQAELREFNEGVFVVYKDGSARKATDALTNQFIAGKADKQQQADAQRIQKLDTTLPEIERLLSSPDATGSLLGTGLDYVAGKAGISTNGAQNTAQLKTLAGQIVSLMPRMEGPQSDKDVAMYKEMAGNLADSTLPIDTRKAALAQIKRLNDKYKVLNKQAKNGGGATAGSSPANGTDALHKHMTGD